jgi:hypothetical protein
VFRIGWTSGRASHTEVRDVAQRVVETIGEIGCADHQSQLNDLPFIVILAQILERAGTDGRCSAGDALGVQDGSFFLLVK